MLGGAPRPPLHRPRLEVGQHATSQIPHIQCSCCAGSAAPRGPLSEPASNLPGPQVPGEAVLRPGLNAQKPAKVM